jgi:TRAP-type transport system small permease protein
MTGDAERSTPNRRTGWLVTIERSLAAFLLLTILGTMSAQVVARYGFRAPISWSEEWARFALIWMAFLAAAFVMAEGRHIAVDVVSPWFSPKGKRLLECFSNTAVVIACLLLVIGGIRFVFGVRVVGSPTLGIPKSLWYGAASTGLGLMAIHSLGNLVAALRNDRTECPEPSDQDAVSTRRGEAP